MNNTQNADTEGQIQRYTNFLAADPDNITLLMNLGQLCHQAGDFDTAEAHFKRVLSLQPEHPTATSQLANVRISQHRFAEAETLLRSLADAARDEPVLQYNLGMALYYQEKFDDALAGFQAASEAGVESPQNLAYRAHCLHAQGKFSDALALASESARQAPGERINSYVALLQMDNGDLQTADRLARDVLEEFPENVDANIVAGTYCLQQQDIERALRYLEQSLKGEPSNARGWQGLGLVRMYEQDFAGAIEAFKTSLEYHPRNTGTLVTLGWACIGHDDLPAAEAAFRQALEIDRNFGEAHGGLAVVFALTKREDQAKETIKKARGLNKGGFGAMFAQTILLEAHGQRDRAVRLFGESLLRRPSPDSMRLIDAIELFAQRQAAKQGPPRLLERD